MSLVYRILKALVQLVLWIFYPKTTVISKERLRFKESAIVISNHPNTLIDPLQVASRVHKQVFFLANAGLFSTPFTNWLFNTLYCIPIKRKQDKGAPGMSNEDSFAKCDAFLGGGGVLYIAPEGGSEMERRVRPFKTGTVRIALSAAQKKAFDLDISILPIGLHYDQPNYFDTACIVNVGEAVKIRDWQEQFDKDPQQAVRALTDQLEDQVRSLVIDVAEGEQQQLHPLVEKICRNDAPLDAASDFKRGQTLARQLKEAANKNSDAYQRFREQAQQYLTKLGTKGIEDKNVSKKKENSFLQLLVLILGLPVFIYGTINHLLAAGIPVFLARTMKVYIGYQATIKAMVGLFSIPIFYLLQSKVISWYAGNTLSWIYLLSLPVVGWLAWKYWIFGNQFRSTWNYARLKPQEKESLQEQRTSIATYIQASLLKD